MVGVVFENNARPSFGLGLAVQFSLKTNIAVGFLNATYDDGQWGQYVSMIANDVSGAGTHVYFGIGDAAFQNRYYEGNFYVGSEGLPGDNPYRSWMTSKAWPLNEELDRHILYFQQVNIRSGYLKKLHDYFRLDLPGNKIMIQSWRRDLCQHWIQKLYNSLTSC